MNDDQVGRSSGNPEPAAATTPETVRTQSRRITPLKALVRGLIALALLVPVAIIAAGPAAASTTIAPTTTCGNGLGDLGGRGLICEVTVVNTITASGRSAVVTVRECLGSAGAPTDGSGGGGFACTNKTVTLTQAVTAVTQCNNSTNGGGGTLHCSVMITNNFVGVSPGETTATVNQCIGSGASGIVGLNINCNPVGAATGAAVTQCNGSANGGTLVGLTCTVTGKMASALPITVNQGNGSGNGGGSLVISSVTFINNAASTTATLAPGATATLAPGATATLAPGATRATSTSALGGAGSLPPTSTVGDGSSNDSTPLFLLMILTALAGMGLAAVAVQRRSIRS
jgi:hypothetical protein